MYGQEFLCVVGHLIDKKRANYTKFDTNKLDHPGGKYLCKSGA